MLRRMFLFFKHGGDRVAASKEEFLVVEGHTVHEVIAQHGLEIAEQACSTTIREMRADGHNEDALEGIRQAMDEILGKERSNMSKELSPREAGELYAHLNNKVADGPTITKEMIGPELWELTRGAMQATLTMFQADKIELCGEMFQIIQMAWFQAGMEYERKQNGIED